MSNIQNELTNLADKIISLTLKKGATSCDVIVSHGNSNSCGVRLGKIESVEQALSYDIGLRIFYNQQNAAISFNKCDDEHLENYIEKAVNMAKLAPKDEFNYIAEQSIFDQNNAQDLQIFDSSELSTTEMIERTKKCEEIMLETPEITNSNGAEFAISKNFSVIASSNSFKYQTQHSNFSISASAIAESSSGNKQYDYDYHTTNHLNSLIAEEEIGRNAAKNAIAKLDPEKLKSCKMPVIFHPRVANSLISFIAAAIDGEAIYKQTSFLTDKLNQNIASNNVNIIDNPFMISGLGSYHVDCEGIIPEKRKLVDQGKLTSYLLTLASAKKLNMHSTGHAARALASNPTTQISNLYLENGNYNLKDLYNYQPKMLLVTDLFNRGVNLITGDYSKGCCGLLIENGQITHSVDEITIASNLKDMLNSMIQANDLQFRYGKINSPSILIPEMTIAGK